MTMTGVATGVSEIPAKIAGWRHSGLQRSPDRQFSWAGNSGGGVSGGWGTCLFKGFGWGHDDRIMSLSVRCSRYWPWPGGGAGFGMAGVPMTRAG
jgi:hypothetical protein